LQELRAVIAADAYPLSPRIQRLEAALAKLDPTAAAPVRLGDKAIPKQWKPSLLAAKKRRAPRSHKRQEPMTTIRSWEDQEFTVLQPNARPLDPGENGNGWRFRVLEHGGAEPDTMPQAIEAFDAKKRRAVYVPQSDEPRPQDPGMEGQGWRFKTAKHDADEMPQEIIATDAEGVSAVYVPLEVEGRIVVP
jgi:hypothetical protein